MSRRQLLACALMMMATAYLLHTMGRDWWCAARDFRIWSTDTTSLHNSQHLLDPYTLTHVLHGVGFYGLFWLLLRGWTSTATRGVLAVAVESAWEVLENTNSVIEKYRQDTISLGYFGDSVVNSMGDIAACALGYVLAALVPVWVSAAGFLGIELLLLWFIRDSLLLNILMLLYPLESVKSWQNGLS